MRILFCSLIILLGGIAHADINGDLSTQYYENLSNNPNPGIFILPDLRYSFDKNTTISAGIPYRSTTGWDDMILNLSEKLSNHADVYFEGFLPTSEKSQADSMDLGGSANLKLNYDLGPMNVVLDNGLLGWEYTYAVSSSNPNDYNPAFALSDKITFKLRTFKELFLIVSGHIYTFQDFDGQTHNIYRNSLGLRYNVIKQMTLDWFYSYKNGDIGDIYDLQGGHYQMHAGLTWHF